MLSSPASSSSIFASLPARPPTPPRDISKDVEEAFRFLEEGHQDISVASVKSTRLSSLTDSSPVQAPTSPNAASSIVEKKVGFSPFPIVHNLASQSDTPGARHQQQQQTPLRQVIKPLKSILKSSNDPLPLTPDDLESKLSYFSPQEPGSFRRMLQSVLAQLASPSRDDRRDAYLAVNGALKQYEGVPDPQALCEKMPFIQQFIARDLTWKDSTGRLDSSIVTQALSLTMALLYNLETEQAFDDDFRTLLLDRSMAVVEHDDMPKGIFKLHMYFLSQQRFRPHILTSARVDRLVTILQGSEARCSGNSIMSSRLIVYGKLIKQTPSIMLNRMRDWIEHVFSGLLSSIPDLRTRAIETCVQTGLVLGDQAQTAKIMYELAEKEDDEGISYGDYLNTRLKEMSADKETAKWVPQIWGAVILLFRCKRRPLEKWACFKDWLATIQRALNSHDTEVKHHANIAWGKFVFAVMPGHGTTDSTRSMLRIPIIAGLDKRGNDRVSQQHRQIAMDSYCNLLHYGLRPGLTYEELDQAWDLYVDPILAKMALNGSKQQHNVCHILQGLLKKTAGVWNKNAANEPGSIKPEDLPRLEPRWIRSRLAKFIKILEPVILAGMWIMPDANGAANTSWRLLLEAVAEAGSQEVKASAELKEAMAQLTNFFRRIWNGDWTSRNEAEGHIWLDRFHVLLETAVDCLGPAHFVEDVLSKTGEDDLEAAPTPSNRTAKHSVVAYPAFVFLFALYYETPSALRTSGLYKTSAATCLRLIAVAKGSVPGTLALLHRALQFGGTTADQSDVAGQLWNCVASEAVQALKVDSNLTPQRDVPAMGPALRSAVNILLHGLRYADSSPGCLDRAIELYIAACQCARQYGKDGGVVLGVMEPFAKSAVEALDELSINTFGSIATAVLECGAWPKSRQELDLSRKALWTVSLELPRTPIFDPFEHLYGFINGLLARGYAHLATTDARTCQTLCDLLSAVSNFLARSTNTLLSVALQNLQTGLVPWVGDRHRTLFPLQPDVAESSVPNVLESTAASIVDRWAELATLIEKLPRKDSSLLFAFEPLLCAAFSSPSREIVNTTIVNWNVTFGQLQHLEYSSRLQSILRARRAQVILDLPGFPSESLDAEIAHLPAFADSQELTGKPEVLAPGPGIGKSQRVRASASPKCLTKSSTSAKSGRTRSAQKRAGTSSADVTPKARLRHDDSQVYFAPVEPALPDAADMYESQLLTEHQRDVHTRQRGDAQMYPEFSSSPMGTSSRAQNIAKKLNFGSGSASKQNAAIATPPAMADGNPMSDDVPSSPTPRSNTILREDGMMTQYNEDDEETVVDPPSSPPRAEDDNYDDAQRFVPEVELPDNNLSAALTSSHLQSADDENFEAEAPTLMSDLPSDTLLPTAQLEREAAAAVADADFGSATLEEDVTASVPLLDQQQETLPIIGHETASHEDDPTTIKETLPEQLQEASQSTFGTPSRIEDSMVGQGDIRTNSPSITEASNESSTPRTRSQRKRKRDSDVAHTPKPAKKKIKSSPFRLWNRLRGSQQENEDDIEEEIVVASSRSRAAPKLVVDDTRRDIQPESQPASQPESIDTVASAVPIKRKRGRPRKSDSQQSATVTRLKRSASVLSATSTDASGNTSIVNETPVGSLVIPRPRKSARLSQDANHTDIPAVTTVAFSRTIAVGGGKDSLSPPPAPAAAAAAAAAAQLEQPSLEAGEDEAGEDKEQLDALAQLSDRRILQPKSILSRLRGVLADCKKMVFGSPQEEREFDDVLFRIRCEVHEAGRQARTHAAADDE